MRDREPETIGDVIEDLSKSYGLNPDQRISTLIKAAEDDELEEHDQDDDELEDDEYESELEHDEYDDDEYDDDEDDDD